MKRLVYRQAFFKGTKKVMQLEILNPKSLDYSFIPKMEWRLFLNSVKTEWRLFLDLFSHVSDARLKIRKKRRNLIERKNSHESFGVRAHIWA